MTPNREQIITYIREHPGTSTKQLVAFFEDPADKIRFHRAYQCVYVKLAHLADRGDVVRLYPGNTKDGQFWEARQ